MSQCEYYYKYANGKSKQCEEFSLPSDDTGDNKCIFHSSDINKDVDSFREAMQNKDDFNFTGYVFPDVVKSEIFSREAIEKGSESSEKVIFNKNMIFKHASFLKGIAFSNRIFKESIDMSECQFYGECYLNESEFKGKVFLDGSTVQDKLSFDKSKFYATLSWENDPSAVKASEGEISFTNIEVRDSEQINFSYVDLSRWSFIGSDIDRINFKFCTWADSHSMKKCNGRSKNTCMLYDELNKAWDYKPFRNKCLHSISVDSKDRRSEGGGYDKETQEVFIREEGSDTANVDLKDNKKYDEILSLYRGLRMNYESKLQYKEAGGFHVGEMEARRLLLLQNNKRKIMPFFEYFFMWLYKSLSDYGENYLKALLLFSFMIFIFAVLFMLGGLQKNSDNMNLTSKGHNVSKENIHYVLSIQLPSTEDIKDILRDFIRSLIYSFSVATIFLKDKQYTYMNSCSYYLFVIESCFGAIILPLLILAVRRNFKRSTKEKFYG